MGLGRTVSGVGTARAKALRWKDGQVGADHDCHGGLSKELGFYSQCLGRRGRTGSVVGLLQTLVREGSRADGVSCSAPAPLGFPQVQPHSSSPAGAQGLLNCSS